MFGWNWYKEKGRKRAEAEARSLAEARRKEEAERAEAHQRAQEAIVNRHRATLDKIDRNRTYGSVPRTRETPRGRETSDDSGYVPNPLMDPLNPMSPVSVYQHHSPAPATDYGGRCDPSPSYDSSSSNCGSSDGGGGGD